MLGAYMRSLNQRERALIAVGAFALVASLVYVLFLEPQYQRLRALRSQVPAQYADLVWMKSQIERHAGLLSGREQSGEEQRMPLLTVIEQTSTRAGLREKMTRMQPAEEGRVRVWFDDAPFDPWLRWVDSLRGEGISVNAVNVNRAGEGTVDVRLTLGS